MSTQSHRQPGEAVTQDGKNIHQGRETQRPASAEGVRQGGEARGPMSVEDARRGGKVQKASNVGDIKPRVKAQKAANVGDIKPGERAQRAANIEKSEAKGGIESGAKARRRRGREWRNIMEAKGSACPWVERLPDADSRYQLLLEIGKHYRYNLGYRQYTGDERFVKNLNRHYSIELDVTNLHEVEDWLVSGMGQGPVRSEEEMLMCELMDVDDLDPESPAALQNKRVCEEVGK